MPYGLWSDPITAFNVVSGNRPPRPNNPTANRWLIDPIWDVISRSWDHDPQLRLPAGSLRRAFVGPEPEQERDTLVVGGGGGEYDLGAPLVNAF